MKVFKSNGQSIVLLVIAAFAISTVTAKPLADENQTTDIAPRCGEVLTNNTGGIIYKPFENVSENERCVWIVGADGAVGYDVEVIYLGENTNQSEGGQGLLVTGVRHARDQFTPPTLSNHLPTADDKIRISNSHILIITFYSGNDATNETSSGFILRYTSLLTGNITATNSTSSHRISEPASYKIRYPPSAGNYGNNELAAFAFTPKGNVYEGSQNHVVFNLDNTEDNCYDPLWTYKFNLNGTYQYHQTGRLCKATSSSLLFPYDDLALALFNTDLSRSGPGIEYSIYDFK